MSTYDAKFGDEMSTFCICLLTIIFIIFKIIYYFLIRFNQTGASEIGSYCEFLVMYNTIHLNITIQFATPTVSRYNVY